MHTYIHTYIHCIYIHRGDWNLVHLYDECGRFIHLRERERERDEVIHPNHRKAAKSTKRSFFIITIYLRGLLQEEEEEVEEEGDSYRVNLISSER